MMTPRALAVIALVALPSMASGAIIHDQPEAGGSSSGGGSAPAPDSATSSLVGEWTFIEVCETITYQGKIRLDAAGPDGISGKFYDTSNGVGPTIFGGGHNGRKITFRITYSVLGQKFEDWEGTVASNSRSISMRAVSGAGTGCLTTISR